GVTPFAGGAWNDRGLALLGRGDRAGARSSFERAASIDPADASPRQNAARLAWLDGDDDVAEKHLAVALRHARGAAMKPMLYRFLLDRVERTRMRPDLR